MFALQRCIEPAHEKIGVVDAQWIVHQSVPSLGNQVEPKMGRHHGKGYVCTAQLFLSAEKSTTNEIVLPLFPFTPPAHTRTIYRAIKFSHGRICSCVL